MQMLQLSVNLIIYVKKIKIKLIKTNKRKFFFQVTRILLLNPFNFLKTTKNNKKLIKLYWKRIFFVKFNRIHIICNLKIIIIRMKFNLANNNNYQS